MNRTIVLALRDLLAVAAIIIAGMALVATITVGLLLLCLQVVAGLIWHV